ncbi:signal peptidase II Aspartic peptidase. MEROPS family A08 [Novosphingobium sp. CF614]|uniref:signal peptidase II n=1 Tax=Novosphingobium sp. CF614 TaxID=1884364 RepID=UPI0008E4D284|nr:signal peptidase II [Novosphingobium sp. CF614]SFG51285.1 signal peptidase II Aspartic peptidase. MEROPS family A08 [Novosphingobium sp. CF614]
MNGPWARRLAGIVVAVLVFIVDQVLKQWIAWDLGLYNKGLIELLPIFDLRWTQNFGVSLGLFTAGSVEGRWALVAMTAAIATFVLVWMLRERKMVEIAALALVLGGALGNIRDRYTFGYVIDYADLHFGSFRPFLIFNLADAAITIGVLIILARSLLSREKPDAAAPTASGNAAPES